MKDVKMSSLVKERMGVSKCFLTRVGNPNDRANLPIDHVQIDFHRDVFDLYSVCLKPHDVN
jgi:hypothetical protein